MWMRVSRRTSACSSSKESAPSWCRPQPVGSRLAISLWRNVEVARELAGHRQFGLILALETAEAGRAALTDAAASRDSSYPHLPQEEREAIDPHLVGFVVWSEVVSRFNLPPSMLRETCDPPHGTEGRRPAGTSRDP